MSVEFQRIIDRLDRIESRHKEMSNDLSAIVTRLDKAEKRVSDASSQSITNLETNADLARVIVMMREKFDHVDSKLDLNREQGKAAGDRRDFWLKAIATSIPVWLAVLEIVRQVFLAGREHP